MVLEEKNEHTEQNWLTRLEQERRDLSASIEETLDSTKDSSGMRRLRRMRNWNVL
jgi:hypothetical protein